MTLKVEGSALCEDNTAPNCKQKELDDLDKRKMLNERMCGSHTCGYDLCPAIIWVINQEKQKASNKNK